MVTKVVPSHLGDVLTIPPMLTSGLSRRHICLDIENLEEPMQHESAVSSTWRALSHESASAIEKVGRAVVAVHARRRIPASGVHWRPESW